MRLFGLFSLLVLLSGVAMGQHLTADEVKKILEEKKNVFFLDVREPKEIEETGGVEGYVNIPVGQLEKRISEVPKDKLILTACKRGVRAARAQEILNRHGYKTLGACGMDEWKQKGYKTVPARTQEAKQPERSN